MLQLALYPVAIGLAFMMVRQGAQLSLREEAGRLYAITAYIIRWAFFAVLLVGFADALISFLRVEGILENVVGAQLTSELGRPNFRGLWVHIPLCAVALVFAAMWRKTLGFIWLALLVVVAELMIVFTRFIFSYEQAFMGDLVRFWYAALFLFASAYTLIEEGHVRVDVLYAGFPEKRKGWSTIGVDLAGHDLVRDRVVVRHGRQGQHHQLTPAELRGLAVRLRHVHQVHDGRLPGGVRRFHDDPVRRIPAGSDCRPPGRPGQA
jgi:hypothetical protein